MGGSSSSSVRYAEPRDLTQLVSLEWFEYRGMGPSTDEVDLVALIDDDPATGARILVTDKVDACAVCFVDTTELYIKSLCGTTGGKTALVRSLADNYGRLRIHLPPGVDARILFEQGFRVNKANFAPPSEAKLDEAYWTRCEMFTLG